MGLKPLHPATWLFYAVATLFLGLLSVAQGGAIMLAKVIGGPESADRPETLMAVLIVLTLAFSLSFFAGGAREAMARYSGRAARPENSS
jgi:hypothetical protein